MDDRNPHGSRRRFLRATGCGTVIGLAGCLNRGGEMEQRSPDKPADWCFDQLDETVSEGEANTTSIDGVDRKDEDELQSKEEAAYQCSPSDDQQCGNCTFYIDDRDGDAIGACTEVAGEIRSVDWCSLWAPRDKMTED